MSFVDGVPSYNVNAASHFVAITLSDLSSSLILLANVYLKMTRGQTSLAMNHTVEDSGLSDSDQEMPHRDQIIIKADNEELEAHKNYFKN